MAHQEDYHRQIHYASILPSNTNEYNHHYHHNPHMHQRSNEQERTKALYVDFEDAFQDDTTTNDYFGFQLSQLNSHPTTNNLQSQFIETISEVTNNHFSPYIRYQVSRESSRPSTPSDTPPYQPRYNHLPISTNLNQDFTNLNLIHSNDNNNIPAPFTPDAIRFKIKQQQQQEIILPQYFLVKYLGRTSCTQLWGAKAVRTPIDDMVRSARQLPSMNEIPTLEICVNIHGLTLTHRNSSTRNKHQHSRNHSPERHQHGLIPLDNISYAMHDVKYSKIASCIVLRQLKILSNDHKNASETLTECYAFLFQTKDHAHRFALAIAEAFNLQNQPTRMPRQQQQQHDNNKREGRSPPRRSKHRNIHHRTHNTSKYNGNHLRDSKA